MRRKPGKTWDLHRYAFFAHASLMITEVIMGFLTTSVLSSGSHEQMRTFGAVHSGIGVAIPLIVIGSGVAIISSLR